MVARHADRSVGGVTAQPNPVWRQLYRAGGISAFLATAAYIVALLLDFTVPAAPESGGAAVLEYIAAHRTVYILEQILWLAPSVLLMVVFLALWLALKEVNRSYAAIGGVLGIASWAVTLAYPATGGGAPALVSLSDRYLAAATAAERASFAAAAEGFIALNTVPTMVGVLETIAILILSLVMLRGAVGRRVAYLGVVTGAAGIVCESLKPVLGLGYITY
ncbi:MAG TPA: hypothetical protein VFI42_19890, partial [Thermomicrobiaceae bacterium]|nr:hypothetical protein [Thermomicrobiaceae bacterium]